MRKKENGHKKEEIIRSTKHAVLLCPARRQFGQAGGRESTSGFGEWKMITIVSGLPRSGTSMMMQMLDRGGMVIVSDGERAADEDNPKGYYELEAVKRIESDTSWLATAEGKAFKMVYLLLYHLPQDRDYKIIFMLRNVDEVVASQNKMLDRLQPGKEHPPDSAVAGAFRAHLDKVKGWLAEQSNVDVIYVSYNEVLKSPAPIVEKINGFMDGALDEDKMLAVVDPELYRQRS